MWVKDKPTNCVCVCEGGAHGGWGGDEQDGQTREKKTALEHTSLPHVNQYSSPDVPVEQRGQRGEVAERQKIQREDCEMACVQKENPIGGEERKPVMHVLRGEGNAFNGI